MAQSLEIQAVRRRTLVFTDTHYGLKVQAKRLNNGRSTRRQYVVFIPANPETGAQTAIVERQDIKAALEDGLMVLSGREV